VQRSFRTRHPSQLPGWGPAPGWGQPQLPGWAPLVDHGPLPLRLAQTLARWWWPTLALAGFGTVVGVALGHDHPAPGLSTRGLVTIALAALVVVLLTVHRRAGPGALALATAEYAVVAALAGLLVASTGSIDQPPTNPTSAEATRAATAQAESGEGRPGILRVAAGAVRAVTTAARAVTGAVGWLVDLWRQADAKTDPDRAPSTTTPTGKPMPRSPTLPSLTRRPL
jgi:hypothetical protein